MRSFLYVFSCSVLAAAAAIVLHLNDSGITDAAMSDRLSQNLQHELDRIEKDALALVENPADRSNWESARHAFYWVDSLTIKNWNRTEIFPDLRLLDRSHSQSRQFIQLPRGSFLVQTWSTGPTSFLACVLPLYRNHKVANRYLAPEWNNSIFGDFHFYLADPTAAEGIPVVIDNRTLFKVEWPAGQENKRFTEFIIFLGATSVLLFLLALYFLVRQVHLKGYYFRAFLTLLTGILLLRSGMVVLNFPQGFIRIPAFDPLQFASSAISPSIGDFFINSVFLLTLGGYLFYVYPRFSLLKKEYPSFVRWILPSFFMLMAFLALVYQFLFIETIFHNSSISLDITQSIEFDSVRWLALISVVTGSVTSFLFSHAFFQMSLHWIGRNRIKFFIVVVVSAILFFGYYQLAGRDYLITLILGACYFTILLFTHVHKSIRRYSFTTFLYLFFAVTAFSLQSGLSVRRFVGEEMNEARLRFANAALIGRDILGEYLLQESRDQISNDPFIQVGFTSPFITRASMRQKIRQVLISPYFDRYEMNIRLYNPSGQSLDGENDIASELRKVQNEAESRQPGIYLIKGATGASGKRYLTMVPVERYGLPVGFVLIELSLKRVIPQSVYPELLIDNRISSYLENKNFSYAFFKNRELQGAVGSFNYERDFPMTMLANGRFYQDGIFGKGYLHSGMEDDEGNLVVVSSPAYPVFSVFTNFAFYFILGLITVGMMLLLAFLIAWRKDERLTYSARIQFYVYLAFLLPLVAVSVTTMGLIANSARSRLRLEFSERTKTMGLQLGDKMFQLAADSSRGDFEAQLIQQTKLANLDATVFTPSGKLLASSQPLIFRDQLVSMLMNREAWIQIAEEKEDSFIADEAIGKLRFSNVYAPLKSSLSGKLTGILSVPFFDSEHSLQQQQISVLSNILVIFTAVFILFSGLSFFAVRWLTFPLQLITQSLSRTTFTGANQPLRWKSDDEIGMMVKEYNKMVENLERSKHELARAQKESAWREMAKQIAHEIKNPLTPMRLTLQRLEQIMATGNLTHEAARQSIQVLLKQVEILNEIASSFNAFARMPAPVLQKLEINSLLQKVTELHRHQPLGEFSLIPSPDTAIMGDEQMLIRIFSNIVLNALQSADGDRKVRIEIAHQVQDGYCDIRFSDDGMGIEPELRDKVFLPHFSTKKSGSGLGLAIARQGIEQSGGTIWFESQPGKGTTFFIRIPLAR